MQDQRVRIVEPEDRSSVALPVTIDWTVHGFRVTGKNGEDRESAGYFAVFVDKPPMPPEKSLQWMANQETSCGDSACGTVKNLADVYTTDSTQLKLARLPAIDERTGSVEEHEVTIVLLDGEGQRIGESAFYVRFDYKRTL